jgi:Rps23 Pro-64 3,4-dihydroxylase Tpa1-like proline 4-hydroxylase
MIQLSKEHCDNLLNYQTEFRNSKPFKHIVIDNFLPDDIAENIHEYFPPLHKMEKRYFFVNENKKEQSNFESLNPVFKDLKDFLNSTEIVNYISTLTGIKDILVDKHQLGSGCHQGGNGSYLDIHIDFNRHPITNHHRRLNFILFFNKNWTKEMGGVLELWDKDVKNCFKEILPTFNRAVIFETNEISFHGYNKVRCPENVSRKSMAMYYYTKERDEKEAVKTHTTIYKNRPSETLLKRALTTFRNTLYHMVSR